MFSREEAEIIYNVIDKDTLRDNFSFVAFFIAVYENFAHLIKEQIKGFYTTGFEKSEDGTIREILLPAYKEKIKNRIVDNKGNKDELKASVLWLVDHEAFSMQDYEAFLKMKEQRNLFAHQLTEVVVRGCSEEEIKLFFDMFALYQKFDRWWINEIEIPTAGQFLPGEYDPESVESVITELFQLMIETLYLDQSENLKAFVKRNTEQEDSKAYNEQNNQG